jgi:hypothetical protein
MANKSGGLIKDLNEKRFTFDLFLKEKGNVLYFYYTVYMKFETMERNFTIFISCSNIYFNHFFPYFPLI